ncbi:glycerate kinase [Parapusillimonas granuli]|uniref:Glycerate kinase n=1 Tax=Parapusillimonas granuli TaxID=380911 RepID=A0A853G1Y8_9BURK|nr:glycerate kinase [Parapusillimonas granuli]MBB5214224.1 glycerate kinase [Parapusillimonas granuli]NYT51328.1 glycerate kinase [Parapusillimonas granuli]
MRIVIAPDSFKESLSATGVAAAIAEGVRDAAPDADIVCVPMADGGEGSLDAVLAATGGERRELRVRNANGESAPAGWAWLGQGRAFIEMASAAGLEQIPPAERKPLEASTYGVGQLIAAALDSGARHIVIGLGGSATNDAGAGLLQALGVKLLDAGGEALPPGGAALARLHRIDLRDADPRLKDTVFELAVDVDNPLCGPRGASAIFGPQKGASPADVATLDAAIARFADVCAAHFGRDERDTPGMGAAGGLGFAVKTCFTAGFRPGVELVAELSGLAAALKGADLVFTGEGRMDAQTLLGKTPAGVARYAGKENIPVIALAGSLGEGYEQLYQAGITAAFSIAPGPVTLQDACRNAAGYLRHRARDCMRAWLAGRAAGRPGTAPN